MPYELPKQTIVAKPGRMIQSRSGISLTIIIPSAHCIADCHAHIENGACAPLPLLWDKSWMIRGRSRKTINDWSTKGAFGTLYSLLNGETGPVQILATSAIGDRAARENDEAFGLDTLIGKSRLYAPSAPDSKVRDFYSFIVVQMMDMEYAHIAGLDGQTIYHNDESPWYFYARQSGVTEESKGKKILLPGENQKTFQKFGKQLRETTASAIANPLRLFPMYGYAPQRWKSSKTTPFDQTRICGPWDYPFSQVATGKNKGIFVGFRMYNPLGSQPLDPRLPYLHDNTLEGDCFYGQCEREGIPILVHCSPGGMTTHEIRYFIEHDSGKPSYSMQPSSSVESLSAAADATAVATDTENAAIRYFYDNYVHPKAWRKVLRNSQSSNSALRILAATSSSTVSKAPGSRKLLPSQKSSQTCTLICHVGTWEATRTFSLN